MEIRTLRYFWTVAETGTITKAAEQLHLTQPTLTRQIHELEKELGMELFTRERRQMVLTDAGLFLKSRAEEILSLTQTTMQSFADRRQQLFTGHISIGCVEADNSDTMAMLLEEYVRDYPEVTFTVTTGSSDIITDQLDKGLLDVAILLEPVDMNKYDTLQLPRQERWGLLVANDSFLASFKQISPRDFVGLPLLTSGRSEVTSLLRRWLQAGGVSDELEIVGTFNLIFNILPLVERQVGNALVIQGATSGIDESQLTFIPLAPQLQTNCVLVWRKNRIMTAVVSEYINRFKTAFRKG